MVKTNALVAAALVAPVIAGSSDFLPAQFSYRSKSETSLTHWDSNTQTNRDRFLPVYPHATRRFQPKLGTEMDLLVELAKTAVILAAPLAAAWQALVALERAMGEPVPRKQTPLRVEVKQHRSKIKGSIYSVFYSMLLFLSQYSILYSVLEYSKHYIFSIPEQTQSVAFMALWIAIVLGSKLAINAPEAVTKILRFPRPAVAIPDHQMDKIHAPSWQMSPYLIYGTTAALGLLQSVTAMGVWENAGYQTSLPAILLYLAQISMSDLWWKVRTWIQLCCHFV